METLEELGAFTHGIMVVNPNVNEDGSFSVLHFVGYWEEPKEDDVINLYEELKIDEEFGLAEIIDDLELIPATLEVIDYFNTHIHDHEEDN